MDVEVYIVVVNAKRQYSIWSKHKDLPLGWECVGFEGGKDACLKHINEIWTDMTPYVEVAR
ncbi:MbtH family NRPS accessory protein [Pseudomonas sp. S75]|uniref:MbtH family protein n=1 Tax=unclassified Pseudomonas TaxID=196821 RepID=UPI00190784A3|nr:MULTISPECIES: MbtH family NRPS accessory protein [unclassified Pseudomonas]MBJ9978517.1 MbtH family NRPS accessory protein [Pseudomonas sp. S30]MBK0156513.1 MbtH family NRPS accessory protein [Pseudomonas sp. S75]